MNEKAIFFRDIVSPAPALAPGEASLVLGSAMTHPFQRYTAAGNTFLVMNTWDDPLSLSREAMRALVQMACDHKGGPGADGMILINQSGLGASFRMDFYNPDGSTGMLCGNGARCAVLAARNYGLTQANTMDFEALGAINRAELLPGGVIKVYFQNPFVVQLNLQISLDETSVTVSYVDLGSQHVVVFVEELQSFGEHSIEALELARLGPSLRWHPAFAPQGANANIIEAREIGGEQYLRIRTFERGVEGETLACGTGCMSSAIVARLTGRIAHLPVRMLTQSGQFVTVDFSVEEDRISNLSLEGPVVTGESGTLVFDEKKHTLHVE